MKMIESTSDPRSEYYDLMRRESVPAEELMGRRMETGVLAVLAQLRAKRNWHRIMREWVYADPPATELGEQEWEYFEERGERRIPGIAEPGLGRPGVRPGPSAVASPAVRSRPPTKKQRDQDAERARSVTTRKPAWIPATNESRTTSRRVAGAEALNWSKARWPESVPARTPCMTAFWSIGQVVPAAVALSASSFSDGS